MNSEQRRAARRKRREEKRAKAKAERVKACTLETVADLNSLCKASKQAARGVIAKGVDALFIPNDNTVASALPVLAQEAIAAGLPVYPTADSMVRDGGLATVGINYTVLGGQTADMVCRVLEGTPIADIPVELVNESSVVVNGDTAAALGVDVSRYVQ